MKIDDDNTYKLRIILNCSEETVNVTLKGKVIYSRYFKSNKLAKNGIIITKN